MSTFFEMLKGRIREKQQFSEMFITFFCPTYAQPAKDIGFYIVSLVGQVLMNSALEIRQLILVDILSIAKLIAM